MNWIKYQKTWNCKLCSDYMYCKDDNIKNKKKERKRYGKSKNKSGKTFYR